MLNEIHFWSAAIRHTEMWNKQKKKKNWVAVNRNGLKYERESF